MKTIWRVSSYLFKYKRLFYLTIFLATCMTLLSIFVPQVIRHVIDSLVGEGVSSASVKLDLNSLGLGMLTIALAYLLREVFNGLRIRVNNTVEQKVLLDLRRDLHAKLLDLPVSFYDRRKSGDVASRVIEDVASVERAILDGTEQGTVSLLTILGISVVMLLREPLLGAVVFLPLPILFFLGRRYFKARQKNWRAVRDATGLLGHLVEDIQGNRLIHVFALREREKQRFHDKVRTFGQKTLRAMFQWSLYSPTTNFVTNLGNVGVVGLGAYMLATGKPGFTLGSSSPFFSTPVCFTNLFVSSTT